MINNAEINTKIFRIIQETPPQIVKSDNFNKGGEEEVKKKIERKCHRRKMTTSKCTRCPDGPMVEPVKGVRHKLPFALLCMNATPRRCGIGRPRYMKIKQKENVDQLHVREILFHFLGSRQWNKRKLVQRTIEHVTNK